MKKLRIAFLALFAMLLCLPANAQPGRPYGGYDGRYDYGYRAIRTSTIWIDANLGQAMVTNDGIDPKFAFDIDFRWNYILHDFLSWDFVDFGVLLNPIGKVHTVDKIKILDPFKEATLKVMTGPRFTLYLNGIAGLYAGAQAGLWKGLGDGGEATFGTNFSAGVLLTPRVNVGVNYMTNFRLNLLTLGVGFCF